MNIKSAFFNKYIIKDFFEQPLRFDNELLPNHFFKLKKVLYGLKQAPRVWYIRLRIFFIERDFDKGSIDTALFMKIFGIYILIIQIYIDYIFLIYKKIIMLSFFKNNVSRI